MQVAVEPNAPMTREQLLEEQRREEIVWLTSTPIGRRLLWRLLDESGVLGVSFDPAAPDALRTVFLEGRRHIGQAMLARVHRHCLERYELMAREARQNEELSLIHI